MDGASVAAMNRAEGSAAQVGCAGHATAIREQGMLQPIRIQGML